MFLFKFLESKKICIFIHFLFSLTLLCLALNCLLINNMDYFSYETFFFLKNIIEIRV